MKIDLPFIEIAKFAEDDGNHVRGMSVEHFPALGGV